MVQRWPNRTIRGVVYDLSHLDDVVIEVPAKDDPERIFKVQVGFGSHTFTKKWDPIAHTPDLKIKDEREVRCFCFDRYLLSKLLPRIVANAPLSRVYFSLRDTFMVIEDVEGAGAPYVVFFEMMKARIKGIDVIMNVRSAHPRPNLPDRLPVITFMTLVAKKAIGQNPTPGRPVVRKKK